MVRLCACRDLEIALQKCLGREVEFAVLGPVEVRVDGRAVSLGGPKQRGLLALLLLNGNEVVSRDRLIDGLWGERAPASAQGSLDSYVSRLRALLGGERIERQAPGYLLRVRPGELDLDRFEGLLNQGRIAAAGGDTAAARDRFREALELWRGRPLADLDSEPFVGLEAERENPAMCRVFLFMGDAQMSGLLAPCITGASRRRNRRLRQAQQRPRPAAWVAWFSGIQRPRLRLASAQTGGCSAVLGWRPAPRGRLWRGTPQRIT
jgi:hypothetical protein